MVYSCAQVRRSVYELYILEALSFELAFPPSDCGCSFLFFNFEAIFLIYLYFSEPMPPSNKILNYLLVTKSNYLSSIFIFLRFRIHLLLLRLSPVTWQLAGSISLSTWPISLYCFLIFCYDYFYTPPNLAIFYDFVLFFF